MFQKSSFLKCIKSSSNDNSSISYSFDKTTETNTSIKKAYKKSIKRKFFNFNKKQEKLEFSINSVDLLQKRSSLFSSTFASDNSKLSMPSIQRGKSSFESQSKLAFSDNFSDMSEDSESDISLDSLCDDDLNSSLSSVSSLEFEPFESISERQTAIRKRVKKSVVKPPLISSSRSSIQQSSQIVKKLNFEPYTTSSRKCLRATPSLVQVNSDCSVCSGDQCSNCINNFTKLSSGKSGYFSYDDQNICSSTVISIKQNQFQNQNSLFVQDASSIMQKSNSLTSISSESCNFSDYYV